MLLKFKVPPVVRTTLVFFHLAIATTFLSCDSKESAKPTELSLRSQINDPLSEREYAYSFELPNLAGNSISLRDFRGKLVLLNFWATWCAPCVAEMPALERLYQKYKDRGLEVVAISVDDFRAQGEVRAFAKSKELTFPILLDSERETISQYLVEAYPETLFIEPQGKLLAIIDPQSETPMLRLPKDRPWDNDQYSVFIEDLLLQLLPDLQPQVALDESAGEGTQLNPTNQQSQ